MIVSITAYFGIHHYLVYSMATIAGFKRQSNSNFVKLNWATCDTGKNDKNLVCGQPGRRLIVGMDRATPELVAVTLVL